MSIPQHSIIQIISNTGAALKYNSSGTSSAVTLLTASVTALPVKNGIKLTASVSPDQTGTFTFSYQGEKDSGVLADSVPITNGKATAIWNNPSEGTSIISAKYHTSGQYDALKAQYQYVSGSETTDLSTVHSSGFGYTYAGNTITLMDSGYYIFTGSTTSNKIVVPKGVSAGVTLKDASFRLSADNACAFSIAPGSAVNLTLKGTNTLISGNFCAGLEVPGDNSNPPDKANNAFLTVTDASTGSLDATGGDNSAGIGGVMNGSGGAITISGGIVTATGGFDGAGIGGGYEGSGGTIIISGGTITATGGDNSAGIGGGYKGSGGAITISGGAVTATGGQSGAGIGGGYDGGNGGDITISGGTVKAIGNAGGAGIGGGEIGTGGSVTISGTDTNVTALGQGSGKHIGKDIGSGSYSNSGGTLSVAGVGLDKGPKITLLSNGTNDVNPSGTNPQFMFCTIDGVGAKDASGTDIHGCYDQNGKIRLSVILSTPAAAKVGVPVLLTATVLRFYFNDAVSYPPSCIHFTDNGITKLGDSVSIASNGTAQTMWAPTRATGYQLMASFLPDALSPYAKSDSSKIDYVPGKFTPVVSVLPTASSVAVGSLLSASTLSGGIMVDASGNAVSGTFAWASPNDKAATTSNYYSAVFIPRDTDNYNAVSGIIVPVTVTPTPTPIPTPQSTSGSSSHGTSKPSLPTSLTDSSTSTTADLSWAAFPAGVTGVSLSVTPEAAGGGPSTPGNAGIPSDPQGAAVYRLIIFQTDLNLIGSPFVYNIKLLDQNGNPITSFTGTVTVKVAIPTGIHGTPHIFRYEDSTGTFTDLNATVENGFIVFKTTHFSYYVIAGTGDSVTLDTKSYQLPVGASYQIGLELTGPKAASVKLYSTNDKIASAARLKNGNASVTGKGPGTAYIMFDVFDSKNHLLTHASVRVDVKTGIRPRGDSTRQIGVF